jgi:hypothetical protein
MAQFFGERRRLQCSTMKIFAYETIGKFKIGPGTMEFAISLFFERISIEDLSNEREA